MKRQENTLSPKYVWTNNSTGRISWLIVAVANSAHPVAAVHQPEAAETRKKNCVSRPGSVKKKVIHEIAS